MPVPQMLVNVLLIGSIYACIGMGFSLIYGVMNIVNMAHGAIVMLGGYITYSLFQAVALDPFLSIPVSALTFFLFGYALQRLLINRVLGQSVFMTMILTFGFEIILLNIALLLWTSTYRTIRTPYSGEVLYLGDVSIPYMRLGVLAAAIMLTAVLWIFMNRTRVGSAIKATALHKEAAQMVGVDIWHIYAVTYGVAGALAASAGTLMAGIYPITPGKESAFVATAFTVAVLGGLGNMTGAIIGGIALAIAETAGVALLGPSYQSLVSFGVFVLVLIVRPYGIVGKRFFAEVEA